MNWDWTASRWCCKPSHSAIIEYDKFPFALDIMSSKEVDFTTIQSVSNIENIRMCSYRLRCPCAWHSHWPDDLSTRHDNSCLGMGPIIYPMLLALCPLKMDLRIKNNTYTSPSKWAMCALASRATFVDSFAEQTNFLLMPCFARPARPSEDVWIKPLKWDAWRSRFTSQ